MRAIHVETSGTLTTITWATPLCEEHVLHPAGRGLRELGLGAGYLALIRAFPMGTKYAPAGDALERRRS